MSPEIFGFAPQELTRIEAFLNEHGDMSQSDGVKASVEELQTVQSNCYDDLKKKWILYLEVVLAAALASTNAEKQLAAARKVFAHTSSSKFGVSEAMLQSDVVAWAKPLLG